MEETGTYQLDDGPGAAVSATPEEDEYEPEVPTPEPTDKAGGNGEDEPPAAVSEPRNRSALQALCFLYGALTLLALALMTWALVAPDVLPPCPVSPDSASLSLLVCIAAVSALSLLLLRRAHREATEATDLAEAALTEDRTASQQEIRTPLLGAVGLRIGNVIAELRHLQTTRLDTLTSNRALVRELKRLIELLDALPDGLIFVDLANQVLFANRAAEPFLCVPPDTARGKAADECVRDPEVHSLLSDARDGRARQGMRSIEMAPGNDAGREYYAITHWHAFDEHAAPVGQLLLFRNISRMKSAEKLQADFMDSVAHELRTPLTSIRAYVELLIDDEAGDPETKVKFYNIIYEETYRLSQLIDNLLNMSMMESAYPQLDVTPVRMKKLLEDCMEVVLSQCEKKGITLSPRLGDRLPTFNVDKKLISVAVTNILSNAVKYTPEGGTITMSTTEDESEFCILCRDSGRGIAKDHLPRIFDKFFRCAPVDGQEEVQGSGVGLATALQIMRQHGGDITVESEVGQGSVFALVLPNSLINKSVGD